MSIGTRSTVLAIPILAFLGACSDSGSPGAGSGSGSSGASSSSATTGATSSAGSGSASGGASGSSTGATSGNVTSSSSSSSGASGASSGASGTSGAGGASLDAAGVPDTSSGGSGGGAPTEAGGGAGGSPGRDASVETKSFAYVSGYAAPISIFGLNLATGALTPAGMATTGTAGEPTSLAFSPDKRVLYAGDEQKDQPAARVIAFSVNPATGALTEINREDTGGTTLAHVNVHPSGKWVLSANYGTGNVTVFPVRADGGLSPAMPRVAAGGQSHYIVFDSTGKFLYVPCVQARHVALFRFADGMLTPNDPPTVAINGAPRHMALTPDERFAYVLTQDSSTLYSFTLDKTTGRLTPLETVGATASSSLGAHVAVHPNGKFLYTSNRSDNSVSIFTIDANTGRLTRVGYQRDNISYPWWLSVDPSGQFLLVANDRAATVVSHRIDPMTGTLQPVGMPLTVPMRPTYVGVLSVP